jgi:restriction endonuclease
LARIAQKAFLANLGRVANAVGPNDKGRALEDLVCYLFPLVRGVEVAERNALNAFQTEEVDVALWNARHPQGFYFLPHLILVECKNWSNSCGSQEVAYFANRLRHRGCDHGVFLAVNGVTGVAEDLTRAHFEIATALSQGIRVMVLVPQDIESLTDTNDLVNLLKRKLCQLVVSGTNFL